MICCTIEIREDVACFVRVHVINLVSTWFCCSVTSVCKYVASIITYFTFYHTVLVFSSLSNETYNRVFLYKEGCNWFLSVLLIRIGVVYFATHLVEQHIQIYTCQKLKGFYWFLQFENALPSFLVQGFNLMTSLKIIMTSLKTFSYGLTACSLHRPFGQHC